MPAGGIMPARTFRITFSHIAAETGNVREIGMLQ
jgi:hypothetical protein